MIHWIEGGVEHSARWHSENFSPAPSQVVVADDTMNANTAYRLAKGDTALLWRGDYHNARQLLRAMDRRVQKDAAKRAARQASRKSRGGTEFTAHRAARARRARILGRLLVQLEDDHSLDLRRAPDVRRACHDAYGPPTGTTCVALPELLGVLGAHQWHEKGVPIPALGESIHPGYGVFSPVRGEYIDLVAGAPLPRAQHLTAFDLGTGTGVLAAVLARRGAHRVVATDISARAVSCARETMTRLGLASRVEVIEADLYPAGRADLVVCNPPWLPGEPTSMLEAGIYDPDSLMLRRFLEGLAAHLEPGGEGWLVLSDLAEHLGLRAKGELLDLVAAAGLRVVGRDDTMPRHAKASDAKDALHAARRAEVTSLWRLVPDTQSDPIGPARSAAGNLLKLPDRDTGPGSTTDV
ncbi:class I SAM-dependent methyltransferase [Janibacter cremeus]|uniref:SAM-dependent methyltransferase n=1 Tax=Janibacter cremeus TaxID=1285192 RepID=A0A852VM95_9MICO|nr:SAM-dependent methyltransferase [Janibacter cremeus]